MPIVIAGAPRSGTSLVANMLMMTGVYLGLEKDLVKPGTVRGGSYWENKKFQRVNSAVLSTIVGAWDSPPEPEHVQALLNNEIPELDDATVELMKEFEGMDPWGWKDPRNCLTLRYWQRFFPEMKVVFCVRNPIDTFISLHKHHGLSSLLSLNLWHRYTTELATAAKSLPSIVTHFESHARDPETELRRILDSLEIQVEDKQIQAAAESVKSDMISADHLGRDLSEAGVSDDIIKVYDLLCKQGGPVFEQVRQAK